MRQLRHLGLRPAVLSGLLVLASLTALALACGDVVDSGSGSGSCAVLAVCCRNLPVNESPSECTSVADDGTDTACTESLSLYAQGGYCGVDGGRGSGVGISITVPTQSTPPAGDAFPDGVVLGGACDGDVYVAGALGGYAFCDAGVWEYTTEDPADDGYTDLGGEGFYSSDGGVVGFDADLDASFDYDAGDASDEFDAGESSDEFDGGESSESSSD